MEVVRKKVKLYLLMWDLRADEMAQCANGTCFHLTDLNSIPGTHMMGEENQLPS